MFDFGFWEFGLIAVITLIVVGPEKMPALARKAGLYAGKLKAFTTKIKNEINDELETEKLKEAVSFSDESSSISESLSEVGDISDIIKQEGDKVIDSLKDEK